jgi:hypothetical protein
MALLSALACTLCAFMFLWLYACSSRSFSIKGEFVLPFTSSFSCAATCWVQMRGFRRRKKWCDHCTRDHEASQTDGPSFGCQDFPVLCGCPLTQQPQTLKIFRTSTSTMAFLRDRATTVSLPTLYAFEGPGSARAAKARAPYMLIEGFYGNSLQDVAQSVYNLPVGSEG